MKSNEQERGREAAMREAARTYERFLADNPLERVAMEEWEAAPLVDLIESGEA
jgi:hypothetical protein